MATRGAMKHGDLLLHLEAFLALEKALGSPVRARERILRDFVGFIEALGVEGPIAAQAAFDWAWAASERRGISGQAARLSVVRRFLLHLSAAIPGTEVPSAALVVRPRRRKPFLFSADEIRLLLKAALSLGPR
jgi:integrase/recombinase XerD